MKNIIIIALCLAFSSQAFSQNLTAKQLFRKLKSNTEVTSFSIPGFVTKFGALFIDKDDAEMKYLTKKIKGMKIAIAETNENHINKNWTVDQLDPALYEPLMTVKDGQEQVQFLIREKKEVIKELLMFVKDEEDSVMLLINGKFTIKQIKKLVDSIELNDLEEIKKS